MSKEKKDSVSGSTCNDLLSASEAVYGFAAWLTTRKEKTVMSSTDDAAPIASLVAEFCKTNGFAEPRENYHTHLIHPSGEVAVAGRGKNR